MDNPMTAGTQTNQIRWDMLTTLRPITNVVDMQTAGRTTKPATPITRKNLRSHLSRDHPIRTSLVRATLRQTLPAKTAQTFTGTHIRQPDATVRLTLRDILPAAQAAHLRHTDTLHIGILPPGK